MDSCEPSYKYWKLNSSPPQDQKMLFTPGLPILPCFFFSFPFFFMIFIYNACIFSYPSLMVLNMHFLLVRSYSSYKLNYDISGFWKWVQKWNECISLYRNFSEILFFVCWFKFLWRVEEGPNMYLWLSCMSLLRTDRPLTNEIHLPLPPEW